MSRLFSLFSSPKNDDNYEKILIELEEKISTKELALSETKLKKNSFGSFLFYAFGVYLAYGVGCFYYIKISDEFSFQDSMTKLAPLIVFPALVYLYRSTTSMYYKRQLDSQIEELEALRTKQRLTLEELKKNSSYYKTKSILERYASEGNALSNPKKPQPVKQAIPNQRPNPTNGKIPNGVRPQKAPVNGPNMIQKSRTEFPSNGRPNQAQAPSQGNGGQPWFGKLIDAIVGEEDRSDVTQFALICKNCFNHNGLVSAQEYEMIQYNCPKCNAFNPSKKSQRRRSVELSVDSDGETKVLKKDMSRSMTSAPRVRNGLPKDFVKGDSKPQAQRAREE